MVRRVILGIAIASALLLATSPLAKDKEKEFFITTLDLKEPYEVKGMVLAYDIEHVELTYINQKLKVEGKKLGADAVIGVRYFGRRDYIYGYGTAIERR